MRKKDLWIVAGALLGAAVLVVNLFVGGALETGSWGLSFRQEGQTPVGPADSASLSQS